MNRLQGIQRMLGKRDMKRNECAALLLALLGASGVVHAAEPAPQPLKLDIQSQSISDALNDFARQSGLQVAIDPEDGEGITSPRLAGTFTARKALTLLLANTGLEYEYLNERTVAVRMARRNEQGGEKKVTEAQAEARGRPLVLAHAQIESRTEGTTRTDPSSDTKSASALEEIVVTAQKREERLQQVPMSVLAIDAEDLAARRIPNIDALQSAVPGLVVTSGGDGRRIALRGIANYFGSAPLVGTYIDEASVSFRQATSNINVLTYDLERVEVLRGPQGTLYGEGAMGGAIRFITNKPKLDDFNMAFDGRVESTEDGELGQSISGALNAPLVRDKLALRIAGTWGHNGGWIDQPAGARSDFNDGDYKEVRSLMRWQPTEAVRVDATVLVHDSDTGLTGGEDANGIRALPFGLSIRPSRGEKNELYNLTATIDVGFADFLSSSSYLSSKQHTIRAVSAQFAEPPAPLTGVLIDFDWAYETFNQEIRLSSHDEGRFQWVFGAYYQDVSFDEDSLLWAGEVSSSLSPEPLVHVISQEKSELWSLFGDANYKIGDNLTVGAGIRYFEDRLSQDNFFAGMHQAGTFDGIGPRFYARYDLSTDKSLYMSASKGNRSGGFNGFGQPKFGPEHLWTYEVGSKNILADGKLSANVAFYVSDYSNYVFSVPVNFAGAMLAFFQNAGDARLWGVESELVWRPTPGFEVGLNGNYNESEFKRALAGGAVIVGDPIPLISKYMFNVYTENQFDVLAKPTAVRLEYMERDRIASRIRSAGPHYFGVSDVVNLLKASVRMELRDNISVGVFVDNLLNDRGLVDPYTIEDYASRLRPRTYGIQFSTTFD